MAKPNQPQNTPDKPYLNPENVLRQKIRNALTDEDKNNGSAFLERIKKENADRGEALNDLISTVEQEIATKNVKKVETDTRKESGAVLASGEGAPAQQTPVETQPAPVEAKREPESAEVSSDELPQKISLKQAFLPEDQGGLNDEERKKLIAKLMSGKAYVYITVNGKKEKRYVRLKEAPKGNETEYVFTDGQKEYKLSAEKAAFRKWEKCSQSFEKDQEVIIRMNGVYQKGKYVRWDQQLKCHIINVGNMDQEFPASELRVCKGRKIEGGEMREREGTDRRIALAHEVGAPKPTETPQPAAPAAAAAAAAKSGGDESPTEGGEAAGEDASKEQPENVAAAPAAPSKNQTLKEGIEKVRAIEDKDKQVKALAELIGREVEKRMKQQETTDVSPGAAAVPAAPNATAAASETPESKIRKFSGWLTNKALPAIGKFFEKNPVALMGGAIAAGGFLIIGGTLVSLPAIAGIAIGGAIGYGAGRLIKKYGGGGNGREEGDENEEEESVTSEKTGVKKTASKPKVAKPAGPEEPVAPEKTARPVGAEKKITFPIESISARYPDFPSTLDKKWREGGGSLQKFLQDRINANSDEQEKKILQQILTQSKTDQASLIKQMENLLVDAAKKRFPYLETMPLKDITVLRSVVNKHLNSKGGLNVNTLTMVPEINRTSVITLVNAGEGMELLIALNRILGKPQRY